MSCRECDWRKYGYNWKKERLTAIHRSAVMDMSTNLTQSLENAFKKVLQDYMDIWHKNVTTKDNEIQATLEAENFDYVILYLMVMIGIFSFIIVAILVSTTRSKRHKYLDDQDPYSRYIANDFPERKGTVLENPSARSYPSSISS
ncbi:potassium voltage-gated channel subfamily E member 2 [Anomaloglossus baeobatrachus]|uniref:potassium voltage-gated channel subfamily E member 2 n=1 Tax=Anomaloglossus baeobatrachus TaxID=238106 RepID=UPI003F4F6787